MRPSRTDLRECDSSLPLDRVKRLISPCMIVDNPSINRSKRLDYIKKFTFV